MELDGMAIVLQCLAEDFAELEAQAVDQRERARCMARDLDHMEARVAALQQYLPTVQPTSSLEQASPLCRPVTESPDVPPRDWETIRHEAEDRLRNRGIDLATVALDTLLDPAEVKRIERRFRGGFRLSTRLDAYDIAAAVAAGLTAALVDFLVVKIPKDLQYLGKLAQEGSPLTQWLHSLSIPDDNWLARYFKTSYDRVTGLPIEGFGGRTHRLQTFGHDPLIGLVIGTIDIMRGSLTAISKDGTLVILDHTGIAHYNPFTALVWQIMHLCSDGFTKMGLPVPGWSLLQLFHLGSFGEKERTVADLARFMYLKGYDSRHFLTMSTSVAAAEVVLRGYFGVRRSLDSQYEADVAQEAEVAGAEDTGSHPRFQAMALAAHGIAVAANIGKVAMYAGNPLAINYAQWLRFCHALFQWMHIRMRSPSAVLIGHARANWKALEQGWPGLDAADPSFPELIVS
jgi:hypothetical protein